MRFMPAKKTITAKTEDFLTTAAKAVGDTLGSLVARSGLAKAAPPVKASAKKKSAPAKSPAVAKTKVVKKAARRPVKKVR